MDDVAVRDNMGAVLFLVRAPAVHGHQLRLRCRALRSCRDPVRGIDVFERRVGSLLGGL